MEKMTEYLVGQSAKPAGRIGRLMMRIMNRAYLPMAQWAIGLVGGQGWCEVLDIGTGNGASTQLLAKRFEGAGVEGVDISPDAVAEAQRRHPSLDFAVADVQALHFADRRFGLVCAFQTHFHWGDLPLALAECRRVLRPGGRMLLAFEAEKLRIFKPEYTVDQAVLRLAQEAGFQGVDIRRRGTWQAWILKA